MKKDRNVNFKLQADIKEEAEQLAKRCGFTTLTGMIIFMIKNSEKILKLLINK